jgi:predicted nucleic acid-binding protein
MRILVDTSALYAILDEDDQAHRQAVETWHALLRGAELITHNYVHAEAAQLIRRRLGPDAAAQLVDTLLPALQTIWVDASLHSAALEAWRAVGWRGSLVDQASFITMRRHGIDVAFAYDRDFESAGFRLAAAARPPDDQYESTLSGESDLVGVAEIAARSGHPTSTIQSWRRRHAGFPMPFAALASGPVWRWSTVDRWIRAEPRRQVRAHGPAAQA